MREFEVRSTILYDLNGMGQFWDAFSAIRRH